MPALPVRNVVIALLVGTAAGVLVLGVGGRIAMRVIALAAGLPTGFDIAGSLEVLAAGAWRGALGGLLYPVLSRFLPAKLPWRGLSLGVVVFAFSLLTLRPGLRQQVVALDVIPLATALFGASFIIYGLAVDLVVSRLIARRPTDAARER